MVGDLWPYVRTPMHMSYLAWAFTWLVVAGYYLSASRRQWLIMFPEYPHGRVRLMVALLWRIVGHSMGMLLRGQLNTPLPAEQHRYPSGMLLQHGVVCSAVCSFTLGVSSMTVDRTSNSVWYVCTIIFCITLSTLGGLLHLYPPMRANYVGLWRTMVLVATAGAALVYATAFAAYVLS